MVRPSQHLRRCAERFTLKERAWAAQHDHTAVCLSQALKMLGLPSPSEDRCIVLRGRGELPAEVAHAIAAQCAKERG